jgi:N-acyl-D-aspartate/D-glutamate deacylase
MPRVQRPDTDLAINDGLFFDGTGRPGKTLSLAIRDGRVAEIREAPFSASEAREIVDARGLWVMPGFVDLHTHYDAEVLAAPALSESLRHGVTTVLVGSCSLGTVLSDPLDIADMFTRVEAVPREHVLPLFEANRSWRTPAEYRVGGRLAVRDGVPLPEVGNGHAFGRFLPAGGGARQ